MTAASHAGPLSRSVAAPRPRGWIAPLLLALLFTLLGSIKPMHIDETANYYYAIHIADHPLDPFGFKVFWYQHPQDANEVLTPPVMVSWWALGVRLLRPLGEQPLLWKLWLLPFTLLFVFALDALLRRFARGLETPLLWMTVLSPAILPGLNLMPDVPALAFSLGSLVVFLGALEMHGGAAYRRAALAGVLAGLAMQTKYTGFVTLPVLLAAALLLGKVRLWPIAVVPAVAVFVGWEIVTARLYGESHFLFQLRGSAPSLEHKLGLLLPLLSILGGVAPIVGLLGLAALGARRFGLATAGVIVALGYLKVACVGVSYSGTAKVNWLGGYPDWLPFEFSLSDVLYAIWGLCLVGILAAVAWRLCRLGHYEWWEQLSRWRNYRVEWFLVLWLALEVAGYFALTPFPAVRRVMGIVLAATLLTGRLASRTCRSPQRRGLVFGIAIYSVVLGLAFQSVDVCDAHAQKRAAEMAAVMIRQRDDEGTIWYVGHWGFQYYAERAGMVPVEPDVKQLRAGDWLVVPDHRLEQQWLKLDDKCAWPTFHCVVDDAVPLRTVRGYYGGWTPLEHQQGPRLVVQVRRVATDFIPATDPSR